MGIKLQFKDDIDDKDMKVICLKDMKNIFTISDFVVICFLDLIYRLGDILVSFCSVDGLVLVPHGQDHDDQDQQDGEGDG